MFRLQQSGVAERPSTGEPAASETQKSLTH